MAEHPVQARLMSAFAHSLVRPLLLPIAIGGIVLIFFCGPSTAAERIGNISDVDPPEIEIRINRSGIPNAIGPGAAIELGDFLSIRQWCRTHKVHSLVVVTTKFGERRLDCDKDEVTFTDRGPTFPPPPDPTLRSIQTITSDLQKTIRAVTETKSEVSRLSGREANTGFLMGFREKERQRAAQEADVASVNPNYNRPPADSWDIQTLRLQLDAEKKELDARTKQLESLCQELWRNRNMIYKASGYCFKDPRAVAAFGNAGCVYANEEALQLSAEVRQVIASSLTTETQYCK